MTLLLSNEDVEAALSMADCIAAMETAYRDLGEGDGANGMRSEILTPTSREDALYGLMTMSGVVPRFRIAAVRINSDILTWPGAVGNGRRAKIPAAPGGRYTGLVLLFATDTGEPLAIYPDGVAQRMRVGATSGLAAKYLARGEAQEVALIGTGWQAGAQAMAIAAVRKLSRIRCYSPNREKREAFAREMTTRLNVDTVAVPTAREAITSADIVLCATNSTSPVLDAEWLEPGMHVSSLSRLELDPRGIAAAGVTVVHVRDTKSVTIRTHGAELAQDIEKKKSALAGAAGLNARPELADLLLGREAGRRSAQDVTLFLNYAGLGYQFAATGHVIYRKARELGLGRNLDTALFTSATPS